MINFQIFDLMFTIVPIMIFVIFSLTIALMVSPKSRGKMMSKNIKATRYAYDEAKDDLKTINDIKAETESDAITTKARAFKKGFKDEVYCKHCGYIIDSDSTFCKKCGKKQQFIVFLYI